MSQELIILGNSDVNAGSSEPLAATDTGKTKTEVGNYFVSNYPPFSQWKPEYLDNVTAVLNEPPRLYAEILLIHFVRSTSLRQVYSCPTAIDKRPAQGIYFLALNIAQRVLPGF